MTTAVPSSMTFEMLSRLPPNSFVLNWKEVRPNVTPLNNQYVVGANSQRVQQVLRGAPNEFLLNTNVPLMGNSYMKIKATNLAGDPLTDAQIAAFALDPTMYLNQPHHFFQSSRESFNAGSLPWLDNQDTVRHHEINNFRFAEARRNRDVTLSDIKDLKGAIGGGNRQGSLEAEPIADQVYFKQQSRPIRLLYFDGAAVVARSFGKDRSFQIPLGLYSNLVNSHSLVPLGLMSSYAVNGWQIDLELTSQSGLSGKVFTSAADIDSVAVDPVVVVHKDIRIQMPVIKVLDPAAMESVLSLYEKRETAAVGGVQFPLSLRMNSMAYRYASYPLIQDQSDYFFRIAGTDRSVRAVGFWIYKRSRNTAGNWYLGPNEQLRVTRMETRIGNEQVHDTIEDVDTTSNNVSNFLNVNGKHSGALFSPLPYYQEGRMFSGQQEDDLDNWNMTLDNSEYADEGTVQLNRNSLCYGIVSLENLDRRESDYSGSFQASGKDLTGVGAIEINMRIQNVARPTVSAASTINALDQFTLRGPQATDYEIIFVYAYDSVMEISPQGVLDITNAVL